MTICYSSAAGLAQAWAISLAHSSAGCGMAPDVPMLATSDAVAAPLESIHGVDGVLVNPWASCRQWWRA